MAIFMLLAGLLTLRMGTIVLVIPRLRKIILT